MRKTIAGIATVAALGSGGVMYFGADEKPVSPTSNDHVTTTLKQSLGTDTNTYKSARPDTKSAIDVVLALYDRREKGDEPTASEWQSAENAIDALRQLNDNPELRKIDRMLEVRDATQENINNELMR